MARSVKFIFDKIGVAEIGKIEKSNKIGRAMKLSINKNRERLCTKKLLINKNVWQMHTEKLLINKDCVRATKLLINKIRKRLYVAAFAFLALSIPSSAEMLIDNDYGWSLDMPEGFEIVDKTDDGMSYLFSYKFAVYGEDAPLFLALRLYDKGRYNSAEAAFDDVVKRLPHGEGEHDSFTWRNADCALGTFSMLLNGSEQSGRMLAATLPSSEAQLVLLCYADARFRENFEAIIISILNSLAIDRGSYFEAGIITAYAYPSAEKQNVTLTINNRTIQTQIGAEDVEAADFVVNIEYAVLSLYAGDAKWREAWQRYYRAIFRDSYGRLKRAAFDIQNALSEDAARLNPADARQGMAQILLTWVQGFEYERKRNAADFTSLPAALLGSGCDCDTRSLLVCALLENMGTKCALFVSREYSHALFGAEVTSASQNENARMSAGGKSFLLGETTAHVNMGLVAQEFSDVSKWISVELP